MITTFDAPNAAMGYTEGTLVYAVNVSGTCTGMFNGQDNLIHGFIRTSDGQFSVFNPFLNNPLIPFELSPSSINDSGDVAGFFLDPALYAHGFVGSFASGIIGFDAPGAIQGRLEGTMANHINANGDTAGFFRDTNLVLHGFLRHPDGSFTILDAPGAGTTAQSGTSTTSNNSNGEITGIVINGQLTRGFLRTPDGTYAVFDAPDVGSPGTNAGIINSSGAIVGNSWDSNSIPHGFLRNTNRSFVVIDNPDAVQIPNIFGTTVADINDSGAIIGYFTDAKGVQRGFLRQ